MKLIILVILLFATCGSSIAKVFTFVGTTFPLILEKDRNNQINGLGADISREIIKKMGHELVIKIYPWKRALLMVKNGEADGLIGAYITDERKKSLRFSQNYFYQDEIQFYQRAGGIFIWDGKYSSLQGKVIGVTSGWDYGKKFDQQKKSLKLVVLKTLKQNFEMLLRGRVDLVLSHPRGTQRILEELMGKEKIKEIFPIIKKSQGYFSFSRKKKMSNFLLKFDQIFESMKKNGEISKLEKKYKYIFIKK